MSTLHQVLIRLVDFWTGSSTDTNPLQGGRATPRSKYDILCIRSRRQLAGLPTSHSSSRNTGPKCEGKKRDATGAVTYATKETNLPETLRTPRQRLLNCVKVNNLENRPADRSGRCSSSRLKPVIQALPALRSEQPSSAHRRHGKAGKNCRRCLPGCKGEVAPALLN